MNEVKPTIGFVEKTKMGAVYDALRFVLPAVSIDETRYFMNGVHVERTSEKRKKVIKLVGADGRRLHLASIPASEDGTDGIPEDGTWIVEKTKSGYAFIKQAGGTYPKWRKVVPDLTPAQFTFEAGRYRQNCTHPVSMQIAKLFIAARVLLNLPFVFDICNASITYAVCWEEKRQRPVDGIEYLSSAVRFDADHRGYHRTAVIMPMVGV